MTIVCALPSVLGAVWASVKRWMLAMVVLRGASRAFWPRPQGQKSLVVTALA